MLYFLLLLEKLLLHLRPVKECQESSPEQECVVFRLFVREDLGQLSHGFFFHWCSFVDTTCLPTPPEASQAHHDALPSPGGKGFRPLLR